ncbi:MCE family protein [Nocardioides ultimimeridianus]
MRRSLAVLCGCLCLLLTGCGLSQGVYGVRLPGGPDLGSDPVTITADFSDALDLVPQSSVKLDDVPVGEVTGIRLAPDGRSAEVTMAVRGGLGLTADTTARLAQTSLLGEKYVALTPGSSSAPLADGATIGRLATSQAVDAEEVLGALSMLLTGGGVGQFQDLSREIRDIGRGRTGEIRLFLSRMDHFVATLDRHRRSATRAIEGMRALSVSLADNRSRIDTALTQLAPGITALEGQRADLVRMLTSLNTLSAVTVRTVRAAGRNMIGDLRSLHPTLNALARAGSDLPRSLQLLTTFPFSDAVLDAVKGDYLNLFVTMNIADRRTQQPQGALRAMPPVLLSGLKAGGR